MAEQLSDVISALFSFDYSLTFTREVERIWKRGFSTPAVLFYLVRYPALISVIFVILEETSWAGISDQARAVFDHPHVEHACRLISMPTTFLEVRLYRFTTRLIGSRCGSDQLSSAARPWYASR